MSFIPRVTGGAALRTRSDGSSDDISWWIIVGLILIPVGLAFSVGIVVGIVYFLRKADMCDCLCL